MTSRSEASRAAVDRVLGAVESLPGGAWMLAVSGGRDSMVMLDAFVRTGRRDVHAVATFDHGTGEAATRAAELVRRIARAKRLPVASGMLSPRRRERTSEARWRAERWSFLGQVAAGYGAAIVTAHTRDDQAETILLRVLRDAGARGLAGMAPYTPASPTTGRPAIARPLLVVDRADVAAYARARELVYVDDPSNADRRFARNRARRDLLPALERAQPGFRRWLLGLGDRAARWREESERLVDACVESGDVALTPDGALVVRRAAFHGVDAAGWGVLWPAIVARLGLALDRRGIARAAAWAAEGIGLAPAGDERGEAMSRGPIPLARGAGIERTRRSFIVRRAPGTT